MHVIPDSVMRLNAEQFEEQYVEFKGPGLYLTKTDTLIVLPVDETDHPWASLHGKDRLYQVLVYNAAFEETFLTHIVAAPIRYDDR